MVLQKIFAAGHLGKAKNMFTPKGLMAVPSRNRIVCVPASQPMSTMGKVASGIIVALGGVSIPVWVLCHLEDYKNPKKE